MNPIFAKIELYTNDQFTDFEQRLIPANNAKTYSAMFWVNSGDSDFFINEKILSKLNAPLLGKRVFKLADGTETDLDVVGPLEVRFGNRSSSCRAYVLKGNEKPRLGSIQMLALDVQIDINAQKMIVNPENPNFAKHKL